MERRKTPRKDWIIGKDDVGRAVLEWKVHPLRAKRMEADPCARTYDFLNQLEVPDLSLEDDSSNGSRASRSFNPYDHDAPAARPWRRHSGD
jgi:hypothetical protein